MFIATCIIVQYIIIFSQPTRLKLVSKYKQFTEIETAEIVGVMGLLAHDKV
jgi:hypothetical protein